MAKYDYNELKMAAMANRRIGGYKGKNVFSCSQWRYENRKDQDNFYVLYDDGNKLVYKGVIYGTINEKGTVDEWDRQRTWVSPQSQVVEANFAPVASKSKTVPASAYSAVVAQAEGNKAGEPISADSWFTKLDKEINELLTESKTRQYDVFVAGYEVAIK